MKPLSTPLRTQIIEESLRYEFVRLTNQVATLIPFLVPTEPPSRFLEVSDDILQNLDRMHEIDRMLREKL